MSSPLAGRTVVVTRARHQARELAEALHRRGASVVLLPVIAISDPESWAELDVALRAVAAGDYDWVLITSVNAARRVAERSAVAGLDASLWSRTRVAAVGNTTAATLRNRGIAPDLVPPRATSTGLAAALGVGSGRVLLPRVANAPPDLPTCLRDLGWTPDEVTAYVNTPVGSAEPEARSVRNGAFDAVTFTSPSTVRGFASGIGSPGGLALSPADDGARKVVCIGPVTQKAALELGFRVDTVATDQSDEGLADAVSLSFRD